MNIKYLFLLLFLFLFRVIFAQQDYESIQQKFDKLSETKIGLSEQIQIDVSGLNLYELITTIAEEHKLNISVDPSLNQAVVSNFYDVRVKDIFVFLVQKYNLDVEFISNIIYFHKREKKIEKEKKRILKIIDVNYRKENGFLSINLKNDSLPRVAEAITDVSGKNIVLSPSIKNIKVSAYLKNRPFDQVIEMMAKSNALLLTKDENDFYFLEKEIVVADKSKIKTKQNSRKNNKSNSDGSYEITLKTNGFLSIKAHDVDVLSLIKEAAEKANINYFMYNEPKDLKTSLVVDEISFENLLNHVFIGKEFTYKNTDNYILIGKSDEEGLRVTELIQMENRTIETVESSIPKELSNGLDIKEFVELNGLIVSGPKTKVEELKEFLFLIDKVVPLVQIEVLIVQFNRSNEVQTGLSAVLQNGDNETQGVLFPITNVGLNATSVNGLIELFNGIVGTVNIGKVAKDFYLNLEALENNSVIKLKSTPKIATLSGHEASVSIGETSYYFEQSNRLINSGLGNDILQSGQWKSTEASLSVNIKPFVSKDEHITLEIDVEKSSFLGRAGENAPPGKTSQKFNALIRVKNNEMILLGGLDEVERENSGTGTPVLSRIPIIKWFFSSRKKRNEKSKLHVFIKPTVIY